MFWLSPDLGLYNEFNKIINRPFSYRHFTCCWIKQFLTLIDECYTGSEGSWWVDMGGGVRRRARTDWSSWCDGGGRRWRQGLGLTSPAGTPRLGSVRFAASELATIATPRGGTSSGEPTEAAQPRSGRQRRCLSLHHNAQSTETWQPP